MRKVLIGEDRAGSSRSGHNRGNLLEKESAWVHVLAKFVVGVVTVLTDAQYTIDLESSGLTVKAERLWNRLTHSNAVAGSKTSADIPSLAWAATWRSYLIHVQADDLNLRLQQAVVGGKAANKFTHDDIGVAPLEKCGYHCRNALLLLSLLHLFLKMNLPSQFCNNGSRDLNLTDSGGDELRTAALLSALRAAIG
eukprot:SAG31_NODE_778_length_12161_cov_101.601807_12_plen_195_part_00